MNETNGNENMIKLEIKDWLYNAGLIGLYRILKHAEKEVYAKDNYIEFDLSCLDNFEKMYFAYFSDTYGKEGLWYKLTSFLKGVGFPSNQEGLDEEKIKTFVKEFDKELVKASYMTAYEIAGQEKDLIKNQLKIIKDKSSSIEEKRAKISEIYGFFIDNGSVIGAKFVSYAIIHFYWSGKSFLNKQLVKENMFDLYKKDFVEPTIAFVQSEEKKSPFGHCSVCNRVLNKKTDGNEGLSWLNMDLDSARKTSVYWNHQPSLIVCPLCYMVYTCVPAGFVTFKRKGIFINENSEIRNLINMNNLLISRMDDIKNLEEGEEYTYFHIINLIREMREKHLKKELDNIQVVKYDNDAGYSFNILSRELLRVIDKSHNELHMLTERYIKTDDRRYLNLYKEVIDRLYKNMDLYPIISYLLGDGLRKKSKTGNADLVFKINLNFIGGNMVDSNNAIWDKKILAMKQIGLSLKKGYGDEPNKIQGIAYRLLNNLKTKNINGFMDVLINCHMHIRKEVPTLFVECIDDVERFQALGYAFLIGFMGEEYIPKTKKENMDSTGEMANEK